MTRCTECQTEWTFKQKSGMYKSLSSSKECPYCGTDQYVSLKSKRQGSMLNFLVIIAIIGPVFFNVPLTWHIIIAVAVIVIVLLLQISVIKLSSKEEFPV